MQTKYSFTRKLTTDERIKLLCKNYNSKLQNYQRPLTAEDVKYSAIQHFLDVYDVPTHTANL